MMFNPMTHAHRQRGRGERYTEYTIGSIIHDSTQIHTQTQSENERDAMRTLLEISYVEVNPHTQNTQREREEIFLKNSERSIISF